MPAVAEREGRAAPAQRGAEERCGIGISIGVQASARGGGAGVGDAVHGIGGAETDADRGRALDVDGIGPVGHRAALVAAGHRDGFHRRRGADLQRGAGVLGGIDSRRGAVDRVVDHRARGGIGERDRLGRGIGPWRRTQRRTRRDRKRSGEQAVGDQRALRAEIHLAVGDDRRHEFHRGTGRIPVVRRLVARVELVLEIGGVVGVQRGRAPRPDDARPWCRSRRPWARLPGS